jgi:hypothetical protein
MTNLLVRNETKRQKGEKRALEGDAKGRHEGKLFYFRSNEKFYE